MTRPGVDVPTRRAALARTDVERSKRSFRIPTSLYAAVQRKARRRRETVTAVVVRKLAEYVNEDNGDP
jgi:hypothetical protein